MSKGPRMEIPERYCLYCGKRILPAIGQPPSSILNRKFCCISHSQQYNHKKGIHLRLNEKYMPFIFMDSPEKIPCSLVDNLKIETRILSEMGMM